MPEKTERIYIVPLRREFLKEPRSKRSNRALLTIKEFVKNHTKSNQIMISKGVNEFLFFRGFKKPPAKIKIEIVRNEERVEVKLPGEVIEKREKKKTGMAEGLKERLTGRGESKPSKEELKAEVEKKAKEAVSEEKLKEAIEKVKKEEKTEDKKEKK